MKSGKKKGKRSLSSVMRSGWGGVIVISLLFAGLLCFYPGSNIFTWFGARRDIAVQKKEIRHLEREIRRMDEKVKTLTGNRDSLEKFARENFHFAAPDEDIYLVDE